MINAFTVDVEDYFQVSGFESGISRDSWHGFESRVTRNTRRILELLADYNVQATFFVLGWTAEQHPDLVREIQQLGHEIGSHSYWHKLIYRQTPAEFREDLRRSRKVLEDILGMSVQAYRAPSFSITEQSKWALEILVEEGFQVDSSIFPVHHDRYGIPGARRGPHVLETPSGNLHEFPPAVARRGGLSLPVGGGGYFRLFPYAWTRYWLVYVQRQDRLPIMFYIHPWEIDQDQPRLQVGGRMARARHYVNIGSTRRKLKQLLSEFEFSTVSHSLKAYRPVAMSNPTAVGV